MDLISDTLTRYADEILATENVGGIFANLTLLSVLMSSLSTDRPFPKTATTFKKEYDYIIVGGGTGGSVMANRLSQKPCVSVLLLEAGAEAPLLSDLPSWAIIFYRTRIDWAYQTTPQRYCGFAHNNNSITWNSGKALGGGSVLNAMLYVRGNRRDFDRWEAEGATGWGYKDVLPYFLKLEDNRNIKELDYGYHRKGGPQTAEKPSYISEIKFPSIEATMAMGYKLTDSNGRRQTGIYDFQGMLRNGKRCSAAKAYLVPAEDRSNLDILKNAFARKILIRNKKAYGVEFDYDGKTHHVFAKQEVIISLGTVKTPQILMLSGIGPREQLRKFNIPVVADLPVGKNLHEHPTTYFAFTVNRTIRETVSKSLDPLNVVDFIINRKGPITEPNQVSVITFLDGSNAMNPSPNSVDLPKVHIAYAEYSTLPPKAYYNLKKEVYDKYFLPYEGRPMWACLVALLRPESRGDVTLQSTNPYDPPLINPNYYKDDRDIREIVEGLKFCYRIGTSKQMQKVQSRPFDTVFPGCEQFVGNMDQYFECYARSFVVSYWHPVGTARMGQPDDPRSVVDPQLRVIGVDNLRVINAAVMPIIPTGNTNTPTEMIAEKAYDMMKDDIMCQEPPHEEKKRKQVHKIHTTFHDIYFPKDVNSEFEEPWYKPFSDL